MSSHYILAHVLPGCFLFSMIWVGCDAILSVVLITISLGLNGASTLTNLQNNQDLAPNFAGTIYGIINCFGGMSGFFAPMLTGYLTSESVSFKYTRQKNLIPVYITFLE